MTIHRGARSHHQRAVPRTVTWTLAALLGVPLAFHVPLAQAEPASSSSAAPPGDRSTPQQSMADPAGQDLLTIYRLARDNDRRLSAARHRRRGADEQISQAHAQFLPQLTAAAGYEDERQEFDGGSELNNQGWDATLSLTQPIFRRGNFVDLERARTAVDAADLELSLAYQRLVIDVTDTYFDVLLAQDEITLVDAELEAVESQLQRAQRALEVGTGTQTDVDEAQAARDRVRAQRVSALSQYDIARESLQRLIGRAPGRLARLDQSFEPQPIEPGDAEHWATMAARHNLQVRLAERQDELARHDIAGSRADRWPQVELEGRLTHFDGERQQLPQPQPTDSTVDTRSIRLQVSVPLFTGGAISSRIRAAETERTALADELYDQRRSSALDARSAFLGLSAERERIRALQQALLSARSNEASVRRGQQVGTRTTTDVLDAQSRRFATERDLASARYDYLLHFVELHAASGLAVDETLIHEINDHLATTRE